MENQRTYSEYEEEEITSLRMIRLTAEGISNTWPSLRTAIELSLPPISLPSKRNDRMTSILESLLAGTLECHVFFKRIKGVIFTYGLCILVRMGSIEGGDDHLLIYAAYGHTKFLSGQGLTECLALVKEYAKGVNCCSITAYSNLPSVIDTIKKAGGSTDYRLLVLEV